MSGAIAPCARLVVPGRPPSPNKSYGHFMARHRDQAGKGSWKERALLLALEARNAAGWPLEPAWEPRWLEIDTYRLRELDPLDNGPGSLKAILDGIKRVLIWDDGGKWVRLVRPIASHRVATAAEERTEIVVWLADPR